MVTTEPAKKPLLILAGGDTDKRDYLKHQMEARYEVKEFSDFKSASEWAQELQEAPAAVIAIRNNDLHFNDPIRVEERKAVARHLENSPIPVVILNAAQRTAGAPPIDFVIPDHVALVAGDDPGLLLKAMEELHGGRLPHVASKVIVLADDNAMLREITTEACEYSGHRVINTVDGYLPDDQRDPKARPLENANDTLHVIQEMIARGKMPDVVVTDNDMIADEHTAIALEKRGATEHKAGEGQGVKLLQSLNDWIVSENENNPHKDNLPLIPGILISGRHEAIDAVTKIGSHMQAYEKGMVTPFDLEKKIRTMPSLSIVHPAVNVSSFPVYRDIPGISGPVLNKIKPTQSPSIDSQGLPG